LKALVVRLSSIGDVVHTLPSLAALHAGGFRAGWLVEPPAHELLAGHPLIEHVVAVPPRRAWSIGSALALVRTLRRQAYDVALDFQGLWKSALWARLSGAPRALGYAAAHRREPASQWLLPERMDAPSAPPHVIDKNLALLRPLGIEAVDLREFPLPPTGSQALAVEAALRQLDVPAFGFAILNAGGGWASKLWPPERFGEVARGLRDRGLSSLVTWGPGEAWLADRVVAGSSGAARRCFPTTLLEYAELARRSRLVLAADTGPLHIACAVGTPVVGLYGPTDPARNGPFSPADLVVRRIPSCAPCHKRRCATHAGVMDGITTEEVLRAIDRRLERSPGGRSLAV
jgi:ADP-heptose:LPS heptosyltransferase